MPTTGEERHVTFSAEGLARLKRGLQRSGLDARFFPWPPETEPLRPPFRGLRHFESEDAGIFLGREAAIIEALDRLRGIRDQAPPRFLVILGSSGAGKSSFLRAGLIPRLARDDRNFLPLPVVRPERAAISGDAGLVNCLARAFQQSKLHRTRASIKGSVGLGAAHIASLLTELASNWDHHWSEDGAVDRPPTLILPIDQGEEIFAAEGGEESGPFLTLLRDLLVRDAPGLIVHSVRYGPTAMSAYRQLRL